jgi:hypothetical protein
MNLHLQKSRVVLFLGFHQVLYTQAILEAIHFKLQPLFKRAPFKTQMFNRLMIRWVFAFDNRKSLSFQALTYECMP